ncbi:MAG: sigma-70 family RNA polymerase sigma factor, partial [Verrucomicrobia bacterium]|nr:sigma-70 family RNA polymerase sigma factor [Verrucomicrobiota bacterium]
MSGVSHSGAKDDLDSELIASWRDGNEAALEDLLRRYQSRIFSFLYRMLRNRHDAEDAAQEAFIRAARKLDRFSSEKGTFKSWMFQIAYREGLRMAGRRKRAPVGEGAWTALGMPPPEAVDPGPPPGQQLVDQETAALVAQAVESLPEAEKQVVLLRTYSGLRFREIAEVMKTPLNTTL